VSHDKVELTTNMDKISTWSEPGNKHQLQVFLGTINALRPFFPNLSAVVRPMETALGKKWVWKADQKHAFNKTLALVRRLPSLSSHQIKGKASLITDASLLGLGVILKDGERIISIISRKLTKAEMNYDTFERELLAIVWALDALAPLVSDIDHITIFTDHLRIVRSLQPSYTNRRINRWLEKLAYHNITWKHVPGRLNIADGPSRRYEETPESWQGARLGLTKHV